MSNVEDLENKVEGLRDRKDALNFMTGKQENEIMHLDRLPSHEDEVCRLPILQKKFDELQNYCTQLEGELDEARRQTIVFQQETFTLHGLVKFVQDPELMNATQVRERCLMLENELKSLYRQLNDAWALCEAYQHRCSKACEVAERIQKELHQTQEEKHALEEYITLQLKHLDALEKENKLSLSGKYKNELRMLGNGSGPDVKTTGSKIQLFPVCREIELDISFSSQTDGVRRETCDETTIPISSVDSSCVVPDVQEVNQFQETPTSDYENRLASEGNIDLSQKGQMLSKVSSSRPKNRNSSLNNIANSLDEDTRKWRRALSIFKGENRILVSRVSELVEKNKAYIRDIASLEKKVSKLNYKLRTARSIENDVSSFLA